MVMRLDERDIGDMLLLQKECMNNGDLFLPTSREGYMRAFAYKNFCLGFREEGERELTAFLNCSVPSSKSAMNLGKGRLPQEELDAVGHMNTLLVRNGRRNGGIGRDLVASALEVFIKAGVRHVYVTADANNSASIKLLHAMGFYYKDTILMRGYNRYLFYRRLECKINGL